MRLFWSLSDAAQAVIYLNELEGFHAMRSDFGVLIVSKDGRQVLVSSAPGQLCRFAVAMGWKPK